LLLAPRLTLKRLMLKRLLPKRDIAKAAAYAPSTLAATATPSEEELLAAAGRQARPG
jgi:hypothetical protein